MGALVGGFLIIQLILFGFIVCLFIGIGTTIKAIVKFIRDLRD